MATTIEDLRGWFERGCEAGATHMIVACDTFSHEDYPVYVKPGESVRTVYQKYNGPNMQRVMEVYALHKDFDNQKHNGRFCLDFDDPPPTHETAQTSKDASIASAIDKILTGIEKQAKEMASSGMRPDWSYVVGRVREVLKKHSEK